MTTLRATIETWTHQYGAALCPPAGVANTYGEGIRAAKTQIEHILIGDEQRTLTLRGALLLWRWDALDGRRATQYSCCADPAVRCWLGWREEARGAARCNAGVCCVPVCSRFMPVVTRWRVRAPLLPCGECGRVARAMFAHRLMTYKQA